MIEKIIVNNNWNIQLFRQIFTEDIVKDICDIFLF